jgi:hypothetical protein
LLYEGVGVLASITRLTSASPYSKVGVIFKIPNKWTSRDDLYVLELTRNVDNFLDAFLEIPHPGVCLFRLFERIHQFHGLRIWWASLKSDAGVSQQGLVNCMWHAHEINADFYRTGKRGQGGFNDPLYLDNDLQGELQNGALSRDKAFWELLEPYSITKAFAQRIEFVDTIDAKYIASGLFRPAATRVLKEGERVYPRDLLKLGLHADPILLRDVDLKVQTQRTGVPYHYYVFNEPAVSGSASEPSLPTPQQSIQSQPMPPQQSIQPQQSVQAQQPIQPQQSIQTQQPIQPQLQTPTIVVGGAPTAYMQPQAQIGLAASASGLGSGSQMPTNVQTGGQPPRQLQPSLQPGPALQRRASQGPISVGPQMQMQMQMQDPRQSMGGAVGQPMSGFVGQPMGFYGAFPQPVGNMGRVQSLPMPGYPHPLLSQQMQAEATAGGGTGSGIGAPTGLYPSLAKPPPINPELLDQSRTG